MLQPLNWDRILSQAEGEGQNTELRTRLARLTSLVMQFTRQVTAARPEHAQPKELIKVAATPARVQSPVIEKAKIETHAKGQARETTTKYAGVLDWPSPERLLDARRARAEAVRDMTAAVWRKLKGLTSGPLASFATNAAATNTSKRVPTSLDLNLSARRARCREHQALPYRDPLSAMEALARAWLEN
jgi:hypothetical protein